MGLDHALLCVACFAISMFCDIVMICGNIIHGRLYMKHRVRKHNLRGSEKQTEHDSSGIELNCISVWHFASLRKNG